MRKGLRNDNGHIMAMRYRGGSKRFHREPFGVYTRCTEDVAAARIVSIVIEQPGTRLTLSRPLLTNIYTVIKRFTTDGLMLITAEKPAT